VTLREIFHAIREALVTIWQGIGSGFDAVLDADIGEVNEGVTEVVGPVLVSFLALVIAAYLWRWSVAGWNALWGERAAVATRWFRLAMVGTLYSAVLLAFVVPFFIL
jgi:hypothetical protein